MYIYIYIYIYIYMFLGPLCDNSTSWPQNECCIVALLHCWPHKCFPTILEHPFTHPKPISYQYHSPKPTTPQPTLQPRPDITTSVSAQTSPRVEPPGGSASASVRESTTRVEFSTSPAEAKVCSSSGRFRKRLKRLVQLGVDCGECAHTDTELSETHTNWLGLVNL